MKKNAQSPTPQAEARAAGQAVTMLGWYFLGKDLKSGFSEEPLATGNTYEVNLSGGADESLLTGHRSIIEALHQARGPMICLLEIRGESLGSPAQFKARSVRVAALGNMAKDLHEFAVDLVELVGLRPEFHDLLQVKRKWIEKRGSGKALEQAREEARALASLGAKAQLTALALEEDRIWEHLATIVTQVSQTLKEGKGWLSFQKSGRSLTQEFGEQLEKRARMLLQYWEEAPRPTGGPAAADAVKPQLKHILVVEDDRDFCHLLQDLLSTAGYQVEFAHTGVEAVKKVVERNYDVVLCDMVMPKMAGDIFYRAVEHAKPELCQRFIFMTGHQGNPAIMKFIRESQGIVLWKPFETTLLMESLKLVENRPLRPVPRPVEAPLRKKILVVEDDADFAELLRNYLAKLQFDATLVSNGVEGIKRVMEGDYAVVLCDMVMPKMAGDLFYRAVERVKPHLCPRFIFMTAHQGEPRVDAFLKKVGGLVLTKPFDLTALEETLKIVAADTKPTTPARVAGGLPTALLY